MGQGYTRTNLADITPGAVVKSAPINAEFNAVVSAFASSTGHTHDGTSAEGGPITKLLGMAITIGDATAGTDIVITFDGETNDGVLTWMEDEDYFKFSDDILINSNEKLQFRDTGIYISSNADGDLDIVSDGTAVDSINIESAGGITLDAGTAGSGIIYEDDGTEMLRIYNSSSDVYIESKVSDKDILIRGNDGGSPVTAVTFDMSAAGKATFGGGITSTTLEATGGITSTASANTLGATSFNDADVTNVDTIRLKNIAGAVAPTPIFILGSTTLANGDYDFDIASHDGSNGLKLGGTLVTASATEINLIAGGTSRGTTAVASGDGILINDAGTMRMTNVDTVSTYLDSISVGGSNIVTTGDLDTGSITSGFGNIDIGSSNLTATGTISLGATSFNDNNVTNVGSIALDTITNDGTDITLDSSGDIILDAAGNNVTIKSGGTSILDVANNSSDVELTVSVADKNFKIKGTDSSSAITALDIDMAAAGAATFNDKIIATELDISGDVDIDGTLEADVITVNGTALNTVIAGVTVTNATTAAVATTVTITDNESTNEDNAIVFTSGGDVDGGNLGLESDGNLTYNPSTGKLTATQLAGELQTAAQTNVTSLGTLTALTVDNLNIDGNTIISTDSNGDINLTPNGTGKVNITSTSTFNTFQLTSADDTNSSAPDMVFLRNSSSPADNDFLGRIDFQGTNSAAETHIYGGIFSRAMDVTDGTEDGQIHFSTSKGGTLDTTGDLIVNSALVSAPKTGFYYNEIANGAGTFSGQSYSSYTVANIFTDTYDIYDIYLRDWSFNTDDINVRMELLDSSGSAITGLTYEFYNLWIGTSTGDQFQTDGSASSVSTSDWMISGKDEFSVGNESDEGFSGLFRLFNTRNTNKPVLGHVVYTNYMSVDGYATQTYGSTWLNTTTAAVTGVKILPSSGTINSGTVTVYGYKSSGFNPA